MIIISGGVKIGFPEYHDDCVKDAIMVAGIFRGGTSMLGKIIGSFKNVEYSFEPPLLLHLDYLIKMGEIEPKIATDILRTYFAEDIMINYHHGRGYNMRPSDDSCIFNMKSYPEVLNRWQDVNNSEEAIQSIRKLGSRLAFKAPAVYYIIPGLLNAYPGLKIVEIKRDLKSILSSVYKKQWFNDSILKNNDIPSIWPNCSGSLRMPYFINNNQRDFWENANEVTKIVLTLNTLARLSSETGLFIRDKFPNQYLELKYEDILAAPMEEVDNLSDFLIVEQTNLTKQRISEIMPTKRENDADQLLAECDENILQEFYKNNKLLGYE